MGTLGTYSKIVRDVDQDREVVVITKVINGDVQIRFADSYTIMLNTEDACKLANTIFQTALTTVQQNTEKELNA